MTQIEYLNIKGANISDDCWNELAYITRLAFQTHKDGNIRFRENNIYATGLKKSAESGEFIIAKDADTIVGYILYFGNLPEEPDKSLYEAKIAVLPHYKGKKIGKRLFEEFESIARKRGCVYLSVCTSTKAKSAIRFHLSCGFKKWEYTHYDSANYYTIFFRKYLVPHKEYFHTIKRWFNCMWTHLKWRPSGQMGALPRLKRHLLGDIEASQIEGENMSLTEVQETAYALLEHFVQICTQYGLRYFLCYGTLLGAVRHKGFIP